MIEQYQNRLLSVLLAGVAKKIFTTLMANQVTSYDTLADKLTGVLRSGLVNRLRREFSWFTAQDWMEFATQGAVYAFSGEVNEATLRMIQQLREALDYLLRRYG